MFKKAIFLVFMMVLATWAGAQTGQVGAIKGTVTLPDGSLVPGVTVTLKSPALVLAKMTTVSNERGLYRFHSLAPGKYEIKFQLSGMNTIVQKGIVVNANNTATVDVQLSLKTLEEQVVVAGKAPTVDRQTVAKATTIDSELIKSIPASRYILDYMSMVPGITGGYGRSSSGASMRDNTFLIDGVNANDPAVGMRGGNFNPEIMEEMSIQTGGISAEYQGGRGATVNLITKSGGNSLSGSLYGYYTHESLKSDNTKDTPMEGKTSGAKYSYEPGFNLGGALIKDKLWFFLNMSYTYKEYYVPGYPALSDKEIPRDDGEILPYLKLTYQPSQNNKFIFSVSYSNRKIDQDGASQWKTEDATSKYRSPKYNVSAHWVATHNSNFFTALKLGYHNNELNWYSKTEQASIYDYDTYLTSNGTGSNSYNPRKRFQANMDGTYFIDDWMGSHELKFGVQLQYARTIWQEEYHGPSDGHGFNAGWLEYSGGQQYTAWWYAPFKQKTDMLNVGLFFNDTWNVSKNLTLTLGLRFDVDSTIFPKHDASENAVPTGDFGRFGYPDMSWDMAIPEAKTAYSWKSFSPRIGIIYDLFSDGTTLLKANFAIYNQTNYTSISDDLHPVRWVGYGGQVDANGDLASWWWGGVPGRNTSWGYEGHDVKIPKTTEFTIGLEREFWRDWSVGLRYTRRWDRDNLETVDASYVDMDALMNNGELVWKNYAPVTVTDPFDGNEVTFWNRTQYLTPEYYIVNPPNHKRDYEGLEFTLRKRFSHGWQVNFSYTYANSEGLIGNTFYETFGWSTDFYKDPNAHVNAEGIMPHNRKHQVKIQAAVKGPWGINVSGNFQYLSGYPHDRWVSSYYLYPDLATDVSIRAEPRGNYRLPDFVRLDLRLEKSIKLGKKFRVNVFGEVFNVFNANKAVGVWTNSSDTRTPFGQMTSIQGPRYFQFGTRIEF